MALNRRRLTLAATGICLLVMLAAGHRLWHLTRYNSALARDDLVTAGGHPSDHGRFAEAYRLQQQGEFQAALELYGTLLSSDLRSIRATARYNIATLTLDQGMRLWRDGETELATPMIELAKAGYREVLHGQPDHWDARYNLELALRLLPDPVEEPEVVEANPERSPQATLATEAQMELP